MYYGGGRRTFAEIYQTADGDFALKSSYDKGLVAALHTQIPSADHRWNPDNKTWLFTEPYIDTVAEIVEVHLGIEAEVQTSLPAGRLRATEVKLIQVEYLGTAKDRGGDEPVAYGYVDGDWSVGIPLSVLKKWFEVDEKSTPDGETYYAVLGVGKTVSAKEIKGAYRRAARQWHPDVCKEPDANAMFQRINAAYQVLGSSLGRRKYDAGLLLLANGYRRDSSQVEMWGVGAWRPPLRCGWLLVEGITKLGRLNVSKIVQWEDVINGEGKVMVSSWPAGAKKHEMVWV